MTVTGSFETPNRPSLHHYQLPIKAMLLTPNVIARCLPTALREMALQTEPMVRGRLSGLVRMGTFLFAAIAVCLAANSSLGQEATASNDDIAKYNELADQVRTCVADTQVASLQFFVNGLDESYDWKDKWRAGKEKMNRTLADFRATACRVYGSDLPQPEELDSIIVDVTEEMYASNQLQDLDLAFEKMLEANPDDAELQKKLAMVYLRTNRYLEAHNLLNSIAPEKIGQFEETDRVLVLYLPRLLGAYKQELEIREKEKQADDLPRVEIVMSSGTIVVELFENEAPETVANFISLVEDGYYDGTIFHRVIPNFMAQGGGFSENLTPQMLDYTINDEFNKPDFRRHFAGSLSMANTGKPRSANAGFFINFVPTPYLDGKHTVFGTVIEGAASYQRISLTHSLDEKQETQPIDSAVPDKILSAKVLRKRDHVYQPVKTTP